MIRSRLSLALATTLSALLLAGCAASGSAPTPSDTATAAPAQGQATAVSLTISTDNIVITNDDGGASTFTYFDDPDRVIAALSEAFGFQPEREPIVPQKESDPAVADSITWDDFVLVDKYAPAERPYYVAFSVLARASQVGGITIETADGISVGDDLDALAAQYPVETSTYVTTVTGEHYYDIRLAVKTFTNPLSGSHYVGVQGPVGGSVDFISAPNSFNKEP